jgi:hypothetical protein
MDAGELHVFDAGRCADGYQLGLAVGQRFGETIRSRMRGDLFLHEQLLPFASTAAGKPLLAALQASNRERYPRYWDELVGTADGSAVPLLHVIYLHPVACFSLVCNVGIFMALCIITLQISWALYCACRKMYLMLLRK